MTTPRILFMGTPEFAAVLLEHLVRNGFSICGVVCRADSLSSRGMKYTAPPVKICAQNLIPDVPLYQPTTFKDGAGMSLLEETRPDIIVVAAYGKILPQYVLDYPRLGCVNLHGSVLPELRGSAPIQRSIINGQKQTGLTLMRMSAGMDEGDIIETMTTDIGPDETYGELNARLALLGTEFLSNGLKRIFSGEDTHTPQDSSAATYAPPISKEEAHLDFTQPVRNVYNLFRGVTPNPGATAWKNGKLFRITSARIFDGELPTDLLPGTVFFPTKKRFCIICSDGAMEILSAIPEGKKEMRACDLINGRAVCPGERFITESIPNRVKD